MAAPKTDEQYISKFAGLQERLYACETSGAWAEDDFNAVLELLGDAATPLMIRLRSFELVGKYAKNFPQLVKAAFGVVLAQYNAAEATQKQSIVKFLDGLLKPVTVTVDGNTTTVSVVAEHGPTLLQQKFEAGENEEAAKTPSELLAKMSTADPKGTALVCTDVLHEATDEPYRAFVLKYLVKDVLQAHKKSLAASPESEVAIKDRISTLLHDVSKDEFNELLKGLTGLKIAHNKEVFGPQGLVDILSSLIDTTADVDLENLSWMPSRTLGIIAVTCPFLGEGVHDRVLTEYLINKWIVPEDVFSKVSEEHSVQILHRLCDVAKYCTPETAAAVLPSLYPVAQKYFPAAAGEDEQVEINFTFAEAFLYVLGELAVKAEDAFAQVAGVKVSKTVADAKAAAASTIKSKEEIEGEKAFKDRMATLHAQAGKVLVQVQNAKKQLLTARISLGDAKVREVIKILVCLENVAALSKPLAENYAHWGSVGNLSWKKPAKKEGKGAKGQQKGGKGSKGAAPAGQKRKLDDSNENPAKRVKQDKGGKGKKGGKKGGKGGKKGGKRN